MEFGKFRRGDRDDRGGSDRPRSGDREDRGGSDRPRSGDREDRGGSDRPRSGDRDGGSGNRFGGGGGNRFGGGGGGNRFGGGGGDRSRYERSDRSGGGDRPRFDRSGGGDRGGDRSGGFDKEAEESVFSKKVRAGKRRTYFFDVRKTRGEDYFITITESTRREDGFGYKRHKIFLYKEDFNRFAASLNEVVNHVKTELMPDFDYEEFDRRQAEWESQNRNEDDEFDGDTPGGPERTDDDDFSDKAGKTPTPKAEKEDTDNDPKSEKDDDDVSW